MFFCVDAKRRNVPRNTLTHCFGQLKRDKVQALPAENSGGCFYIFDFFKKTNQRLKLRKNAAYSAEAISKASGVAMEDVQAALTAMLKCNLNGAVLLVYYILMFCISNG